MERTILHIDINNFYASVECFYNPHLRDKPVVVCGNPEARHGIVLAKNDIAKKFNIKTGEPVWQAQRKCADAVFVPPHYDLYFKFSQLTKEICHSYTNYVEGFGLDENWLDVTHSAQLFGSGEKIANDLRMRMIDELGVTVSVGVSFNKTFAKLGSDYKKPNAVTVIDRNSFKSIVWPLPVSDLLYIGRRMNKRLTNMGITTIGQLAMADKTSLETAFGKVGAMIWELANGNDQTAVMEIDKPNNVKSISNGITLPYNLTNPDEIKAVLMTLAENIATRLRKIDATCKTIDLTIRYKDLSYFNKQITVYPATNNALDIWKTAFKLYQKHAHSPVRALTIHCSNFMPQQNNLSFLDEDMRAQRQSSLETAMDSIKERFGNKSIINGNMLAHKQLDFDLSKRVNTFGNNGR